MRAAAALLPIARLAALLSLSGGQQLLVGKDYEKPAVSSRACAMAVEKIREASQFLGNDGTCMGCDPALEFCPMGCQDLVNELYAVCDGVAMPDGLFFDPKDTLNGEWEEVKPDLKIGVERCGCNGDSRRIGGASLWGLASSVSAAVFIYT
jgi:hypothetical protein